MLVDVLLPCTYVDEFKYVGGQTREMVSFYSTVVVWNCNLQLAISCAFAFTFAWQTFNFLHQKRRPTDDIYSTREMQWNVLHIKATTILTLIFVVGAGRWDSEMKSDLHVIYIPIVVPLIAITISLEVNLNCSTESSHLRYALLCHNILCNTQTYTWPLTFRAKN
jgi:hypothetical protein